MAHPIPLYGVVIHQAAVSGDLNKMKGLLAEAQEWLHEHGDISGSLEILKHEIAKLEGGHPTPIPLYGVVLHQGALSGDLKKMKALKKQADEWLANTGDVAGALGVLRHEIAKLEAKGK